MYLVNIKGLKTDLATEALPQRDFFMYLMLLIMLSVIPHKAAWTGWQPYTNLDWVFWGSGSLVLILGTAYCYSKNGGNKGSRFLERYLSISSVCSIRYGIPILCGALIGATIVCGFFESTQTRYIATRITVMASGLVLYAIVGKNIQDVAKPSV